MRRLTTRDRCSSRSGRARPEWQRLRTPATASKGCDIGAGRGYGTTYVTRISVSGAAAAPGSSCTPSTPAAPASAARARA